jgi:hypothetical protein
MKVSIQACEWCSSGGEAARQEEIVITLTLFQIFDFSYAMLRVDLEALRSKRKKRGKLFIQFNLTDR